mgnify:CR=1 FL=1
MFGDSRRQYTAAMRALLLIAFLLQAIARIVDLRDALDTGGFRDGVHLTLDATESITRSLAKELLDAGPQC